MRGKAQDKMNIGDARSAQDQIAGFSSSELARFLSMVSMELTISARETYIPHSLFQGGGPRFIHC
jgi:hypothetical protein